MWQGRDGTGAVRRSPGCGSRASQAARQDPSPSPAPAPLLAAVLAAGAQPRPTPSPCCWPPVTAAAATCCCRWGSASAPASPLACCPGACRRCPADAAAAAHACTAQPCHSSRRIAAACTCAPPATPPPPQFLLALGQRRYAPAGAERLVSAALAFAPYTEPLQSLGPSYMTTMWCADSARGVATGDPDYTAQTFSQVRRLVAGAGGGGSPSWAGGSAQPWLADSVPAACRPSRQLATPNPRACVGCRRAGASTGSACAPGCAATRAPALAARWRPWTRWTGRWSTRCGRRQRCCASCRR